MESGPNHPDSGWGPGADQDIKEFLTPTINTLISLSYPEMSTVDACTSQPRSADSSAVMSSGTSAANSSRSPVTG
jgi:hypothetical protein